MDLFCGSSKRFKATGLSNDKQKAMSYEQKVKSNEQKVTSNKQNVTNNEQKTMKVTINE